MTPKHRVRARGVAEILGCHEKSVWRLTREDPSFPRPIRIGARLTVWDVDEVEQWVQARAKAGAA